MSEPFTVLVAPEAAAEVARIVTWWRKNRGAAARLFQSELDRALVQISERPEIGRRVRSRKVGDARVLLLIRSGFHVFYQVVPAAGEVYVVHVRHSKRRPLKLRAGR